jgi:hypothetical protein
MQQAGVQTVDPNLLLSLARDNKAADLIRLIRQQGVPVNLGNKVSMLPGCSSLHRLLLTSSVLDASMVSSVQLPAAVSFPLKEAAVVLSVCLSFGCRWGRQLCM